MRNNGLLKAVTFSVMLTVMSMSSIIIPLVMAEPSDPFTGASPSFDAAPEEPEKYNTGDYGVADQMGAATYTYIIDVPPGRNGMAPSLALRYSSRSSLRGGIAVGWTMHLPSVRIDTALGLEKEKSYKVTLGSNSGRLVEVPDQSPYPGKAYRVEFDDGSFARFFHSTPGEFETGPRGWVALTPDGVTHFFDSEIGPSDNRTRWNITRQVDPFGNTVRYLWSVVLGPNGSQIIDHSLDQIEYTSNGAANLDAHAKVEFEYTPIEVCSFSNVPIGAASLPIPPGTVEGARRLIAIRTHVRDVPGGVWRLSKEVVLDYKLRSSILSEPILAPDPPPPDIFCIQNPLRYLALIQTTAHDPQGKATTLPPITFEYNQRLNTTRPVLPFTPSPLEKRTIDTTGFSHYGTTDGAIGTRLDIDSDGISDQVSVIEEGRVCTLVWQKGLLGGAFEATLRKSPLPTALWYEEWREAPQPQLRTALGEQCTLNGQVAYRDAPIIGGDIMVKGLVSYHFLDYTGDGRLDLLTNVWATTAHQFPNNSYVPGAQARGGGPISNIILNNNPSPGEVNFTPMTPEGSAFRKVWRVYRNVGDPHATVLPADPSAVFATVPMKVVSPLPLPPSMSDERLDSSLIPNFSIPVLTDIDGDGFQDVVDVTRDHNLLGNGDWTVYLGDGGSNFPELIDAVTWKVPLFVMSITGNGFDNEITSCGGNFVRTQRTVTGLRDINGTGLQDLVVQTADRRLKAFLNTGNGFQSTAVDLGVPQPLERIQTDCLVPNIILKDGNRGYRRRLADLDGDGRIDVVGFAGNGDDVTADQNVVARFNMGDRFGPRVQLPSEWLDGRRLLAARDGDWRLDTDFVDVTGDGQSDLARWNEDDTLTYVDSPGLPQAPDLLRVVENGRGLRVEFSYAPTTDPEAVEWATLVSGGPHLPSVMWVVDGISVTGGFETPEMVTRYTYKNPRYLSPSEYTGIPERSHFAGFEETTKIVSRADDTPARRVTRAYAYDDKGAPDGRLVHEWIYRTEENDFQLQNYKEITWNRESLFSDKAFFVHRDETLTRTCEPDTTEAECMAQTGSVHRAQEAWVGVAPSKSASGVIVAEPANHPAELYIKTATQEGSGLVENEEDRRTSNRYVVRYGQADLEPDDYRLLTAQTTLEGAIADGTGLVFEERGKTRNNYDPTTGLPIRTDVWHDATTVATTTRTFDSRTGNLLRETKPAQAAPDGSGGNQTFGYDPHQLFVGNTTNELGHEVETKYDVATGIHVQREGPNFRTLPSSDVVREQETWRIDGFGRVLEHTVSIDDDAVGYTSQVVDKTTYFDFEEPNRIRGENLRDFNDNLWVTTDRTADGIGRLLSEKVHLDAGQVATTTYEYDAIGSLAAIEVPDPSTDGARARYQYRHDDLNRLTDFIRPDGNGLSISYAGLKQTIREVSADGSGFTKEQTYDVLGRLIEVRELDPLAAPATTRYRYDVDDSLTEIVGAEGNETKLAHDWVGNRTAINRDDRVWKYRYDLNSNLAEEIAPLSIGEDPGLQTTGYEYDDLDRLTTIRFANGQVISTLRHFYDDGLNAIGRLNRVELPIGEIRYAHDARGLVISEQRSFTVTDIIGFGASQTVQRQYNALGLPTLSTWDDGQQWQITYDERGLVDTVEWHDAQTDTWQQVANYTRAVAGQPRIRNSSFGQVRQYTYDKLGRPTLDVVLRPGHPDGALISTRAYDYTDSGDLMSVSGATNGVSAGASYSYDKLHRLRTAEGPNGYQGSFAYSPAGNILMANVTWNDSPDTRNVRYEYGARDAQAVDRLVNVPGDDPHAAFAYDLAGNMIERTTPEGTWTLERDGLDQIRSVQGPNGTEVYYYDHTGARTLAVSESDGVRFWFVESETHYDLNGTQTRRYLHLSGGGPTLARVENGADIELQYADALQNLMLSLTSEGRVAASFLYGPFGEIVNAMGGDDHRRQFNGKENDATTGLRYYGFRYYDPLILRWNSADPLYRFVPELSQTDPQRMNLYTFSMNNPVRYYDPDGREANDADDEREAADELTCELPEPGTCEADTSSDEESSDEREDAETKSRYDPKAFAEGLVERYGERARSKLVQLLWMGEKGVLLSEYKEIAAAVEAELNNSPSFTDPKKPHRATAIQRFNSERELLRKELRVLTGESTGAIVTGGLRAAGVDRELSVSIGETVGYGVKSLGGSVVKGLGKVEAVGKPHTGGQRIPKPQISYPQEVGSR